MPPMPNANPKNNPDIIPNLVGSNSCAYKRIAGNADESVKPAQKLRTAVSGSPT